MVDGIWLFIIFLVAILFIIIMTAVVRMNAFYVLLITALGVGIAAGLPAEKILEAIKEGFGNTMASIGIVIICGTTIGVILERTGAAFSMANFILKIVGTRLIPLVMSISGYIVGIPIFCDSGFVVLSTLNKALAERAKVSMSVMAVALGSALYSVHCLIPPHPGATAAAGIVGEDLGRVMLLGLPVTLFPAAVGYIWAVTVGRKYFVPAESEVRYEQLQEQYKKLPSPLHSFIPIILPVILIATKSIILMPGISIGSGFFKNFVIFAGEPQLALLIGVFFSLTLVKSWNKNVLDKWLFDGVEKAGSILAITAAGGVFGNILKVTHIGDYIGGVLTNLHLGIFLPFLIASALKTAQGSSTVAIITTAAIVAPMLHSLGLAAGWGPVLALLAMGSGSMVASHANDSYFWVVSRFSNLDVPIALKVYTTATIVMGITSMIVIFIISLILL
ncbi:MAG: GntP family permease [bacterium]|nr:GntP family permease [bacterium]